MITWQDIELKRTSGTEKVPCPKCSQDRKKKKDPCLSVNHDKGVAKCWHCEDYSIRDYKPKKQFTHPPQDWINHTQLSEGVVKWFSARGINQQTLINCKITEEKKYQPAIHKEVNNIVFNYFEGNDIVNKKYRSGGKCFTQEKDAKKIFYGINDVMTEDECYIVEGEMDKLAMWQIGVKNCISVPNGANDLEVFENCEQYIKEIKRFYVAVDMDEKGVQLEKEIVKRLGKHKCERVHFKGKDANDDLISGELEESLKNKIKYPIDGTYTAKDLEGEIIDLYDNGREEVIKVEGYFFSKFNDIFSIIKGQLTTITGIPSHGKSNFIEWYILNLVAYSGFKASFYSPEHLPMKQHQMIMAEKIIGKSSENGRANRMTKDELLEYIEWSSDKIYLTIPEKSIIPDWDWLFEKFEEQIYRYGIDLFVVDAFNKVKLHNGSLFELNEVLARLTLFCQMHNVNIFLIAHPTKMKKEEGKERYLVPSLYDVKGSGDFYDQTHNGLVVYRVYGDDPFTQVITAKLKFRHQGEAGKDMAFKFNPINGRYYPYIGRDDGKNLIQKEKVNIESMIDEIYEDNGKAPF